VRVWTLSESDGRLVSEDRATRLTAKAAAVLAFLIRRKGEAVSRDAILRDVWRGVPVTPDLVREYVADIRAALGDDAAAPIYIETLRGRGVRLIGGVTLAPCAQPVQLRPCIAVLRPAVFVEGERWRSIGDALGEELITELARAPDFAVIARHSSFAVPNGADLRVVSADLGARWLIEIGLTEGEGRFCAHCKLVDGENGALAWAERLDLPRDALPRLTGDVAARVANAVAGWTGRAHAVACAAAARRPAASRVAYEDYLLAVEHEHRGTTAALREAIAMAERALSVDPRIARAWLVLYFAWNQISVRAAGAEAAAANRRSLDAVERAFALDPRDPLIVACFAFRCGRRGDLAAAATWATRACDIGWNDAAAAAVAANTLIAMVGDVARAREMLERATYLDPVAPPWRRLVAARVAFFGGDHAGCLAIAGEKPDHPLLAGLRVLSLAALGKQEALVAEADFLKRFAPGDIARLAKAHGFMAEPTLARWREALAGLDRLRAAARRGR
jgi:TolB-like protein/DNA-binding winged helix-turn-helix (wHTH) protein/Tfp pilus assembly protein PilF